MPPKRLFLLLCIATFITQAQSCDTPRIRNFAARPERVCGVPSFVTLEWGLNGGTTGRIESSPSSDPSRFSASESGSRSVRMLAAPTTFTLTATKNSVSTSSSITVEQMTGIESLAFGGVATCTAEGYWVLRTEVLEGTYPSDVRIKRLQNTSAFAIAVENPFGQQITIPALSASDQLDGTRAVGSWTIVAVAASPCRPPGGVEPADTTLIGLEVQVGCP
jgi:hypothetical protein